MLGGWKRFCRVYYSKFARHYTAPYQLRFSKLAMYILNIVNVTLTDDCHCKWLGFNAVVNKLTSIANIFCGSQLHRVLNHVMCIGTKF